MAKKGGYVVTKAEVIEEKIEAIRDETVLVDPSKWKLIPLDKLIPAEWNYKGDDPILADKLLANMKRNGIIESCIVRQLDTGFYEVVNGNHRYVAALKLNANGLFCYDLGAGVTLLEAQRIAIETNETRFQAVAVTLAERMKELTDVYGAGALAETMPYNEQEITNMAKLLNFDWSQFQKTPDPDSQDGADYENEQAEEWEVLTLRMPSSVMNMWRELVEEASQVLQYDKKKYPSAESRLFEFAAIELKNALPSYTESA